MDMPRHMTRLEDTLFSWRELDAPPDMRSPGAELALGAEADGAEFLRALGRRACGEDARCFVALLRRCEQQQRARLLSARAGETPLARMIDCEALSVNWLAAMWREETHAPVRRALEFTLPEELDHLYRLANLADLLGAPSARGRIPDVEIMPGRPCVAQHRHPSDALAAPLSPDAPVRTRYFALAALACARGAMALYERGAGEADDARARALYRELFLLEEQHASLFESLLPRMDGLREALDRQGFECWLYASLAEDEPKSAYGDCLARERAHLDALCSFLNEPAPDMPAPIRPGDASEAVRDVLRARADWTAVQDAYAPVSSLTPEFAFFRYQRRVNADAARVPSCEVVRAHIEEFGEDFRIERALHPIEALQSRTRDNDALGR